MGKRVGIADVARVAGVSATTVSHALSGQGNLAPATRFRVTEVARELGYAPNKIASALRRQRSGIIGLVSDEIATTPFAGRIVLGAQDASADQNTFLLVVNSSHDERVEDDQIRSLLAQQVDAVVYAKMYHQHVALPALLEQTPTVIVNAVDPSRDTPSVVPDELQIAQTATAYLLAAGHRKIAYLSIVGSGPGLDLRRRGYEDAMKAREATPRVVEVRGSADAAAGRAAFREVLELPERPTAVFCFNDQMAMGVYQVAAEMGLEIPRDLSVIGVDNLELISAQLRPPLTTIALPHYEMGRWGIETALRMIGGSLPEVTGQHAELSCGVIERSSVCPPQR